MCHNAETSIVAFIIAAIIALIVISTNNHKSAKALGFFLLTYILIQLLEFFIWRDRQRKGLSASASEALALAKIGDPEGKNAADSETLTKLITIALWLQPLAQIYLAKRYGRKTRWGNVLTFLLVVYAALFLWAIVKVLDTEEGDYSSQPHVGVGNTGIGEDGKEARGHLQWNTPNGALGGGILTGVYLFGLFFGLLFTDPKWHGWIIIILGLALLFFSIARHSGAEVGSLWCFYSVILAIVIFFLAISKVN